MRNDYILSNINVSDWVGLEIGPLTNPILTKESAHIYYADHMSTDDLRLKYQNEPVELDKIVPIDYILGGQDTQGSCW